MNISNTPAHPYSTLKSRLRACAAYYLDRAIQPAVWVLSRFTSLHDATVIDWPTCGYFVDAWRERDGRSCSYVLRLGYVEFSADFVYGPARAGAAPGDWQLVDGWW